MYEHAKTLRAQEPHAWTWNLVPLLIVTVALTGFFLPHGNADVDAVAAQPMGLEASAMAMLLVPSPQPGMGEPELRAEDLPQSY